MIGCTGGWLQPYQLKFAIWHQFTNTEVDTEVEDVKKFHSPLHLFAFVVEICLETYFEEEKQKEMH